MPLYLFGMCCQYTHGICSSQYLPSVYCTGMMLRSAIMLPGMMLQVYIILLGMHGLEMT